MFQSGKLNIIIDGQFGSCGKGLVSSYCWVNNHIDISISSCTPSAGHTFYNSDNNKHIVSHLPVIGLLEERCTKFICSNSIIDPDILLNEIENTKACSIFIDPRAAVVEKNDKIEENNQNSSFEKISSTQKGSGTALANKIKRSNKLAEKCEKLQNYIQDIDVQFLLDQNCCASIEMPQGFDLSLNSGLKYPYCTSREITVSQALSDTQLHPSYLGNVIMVVRVFPIRVGNKIRNGIEVGYSGPFWYDSQELTWEEIGVDKEKTTISNKIRRVADFSLKQYENAINQLKPDYVFLNFCNYLDEDKLNKLLNKMAKIKPVDYLGYGPSFNDVIKM